MTAYSVLMEIEPFYLNPERVRALLKQLNVNLVEREEIIQHSLLTVLLGQSVFFHNPPGTAKSLIAIRISPAINGSIRNGKLDYNKVIE